MKRKQLALLLILVITAGSLFIDRVTAQQMQPAPKTSRLYELYDPAKFREKYEQVVRDSVNEGDRGSGSRAGLIITPPGHLFKDATVRGRIPDAKVKEIMTSMKDDMVKLAETSKVRVTGEPKDSISDRPVSYILAVTGFGWVNLLSLHGYYFTYSEGKIEGSVEILAAQTRPDDPRHWVIVCSVHEAERK